MNSVNYFQQITGISDPAMFIITFAFGCIGMLLSLLWQTTKRSKVGKINPVHFSWHFFFKENIQRITISLLLLFIFIRFSKELLGLEVNFWTALGIGLCLDKLSQLLKNFPLPTRK